LHGRNSPSNHQLNYSDFDYNKVSNHCVLYSFQSTKHCM
jgi:hypothetical protein